MSKSEQDKSTSRFPLTLVIVLVILLSSAGLVFYFKPMGDKFAFEDMTFRSTKQGYKYKIIKRGEDYTPKDGDMVKFRFSYRKKGDKKCFYDSNPNNDTSEFVPLLFKDELLNNDSGVVSILHILLSKVGRGGKLKGMIRAGDLFKSKDGELKKLMDNFLSKNNLKENGHMMIEVEVNNIMNKQEQLDEKIKEEEEIESIHKEQLIKIDEIIKERHAKELSSGSKVVTTPSGAKYILKYPRKKTVSTKGKQNVGIKYTLRLLDGNVIGNEGSIMTLELPFGEGKYIVGLEEAIPDLRKNEKIRLYVPSKAAYGNRDDKVIPKNSILDFEITILNVYPEK